MCFNDSFQGSVKAAFARKFKRGKTELEAQEALAATRDFTGVTGRISFARGRDPLRRAVIMAISNGKPHYEKSIQPEEGGKRK